MKFFNIYIEHESNDKDYINVINEDQLSILVTAYLNGEETVTIKGKRRNINNPKKFLIFSIKDLSRLGKEQAEIERNLLKFKVLLNKGKMSQGFYTQFGTNVTDKFTQCKVWGSLKKNQSVINKEMKKGKIFISHSSKNKIIVNKFCDLILDNGLNINLVEDVFNTSLEGSKPKNGEDFRNRIKNELLSANLVLQFISTEYRESQVCLNEMGAAWVLSDNVIPLIIEKDNYEVGFIHSTTQQCQLTNEKSILALIDELKEKDIIKDYKLPRLTEKVKEFVEWLNKANSSNTEAKESISNIKVQSSPTKSKGLEVVKVQNRQGIYLIQDKNSHLFPDDITFKLMRYAHNQIREISVDEFNLYTKGANLRSVNKAELIEDVNSGHVWILLNNKRHGVPDKDTLNYLISSCSCKQPTLMSIEQYEQLEQKDDLQSISKIVQQTAAYLAWGNKK